MLAADVNGTGSGTQTENHGRTDLEAAQAHLKHEGFFSVKLNFRTHKRYKAQQQSMLKLTLGMEDGFSVASTALTF